MIHNAVISSSSMKCSQNMNPLFITGFVDGEGCFSISVIKDEEYKNG